MQERQRRQRAVPLVVLGVGLLLTAVLTAAGERFVRDRDQVRLDTEIRKVDEGLLGRMDAQVALLQNTAGMFRTQREVTATEFRDYVASLDIPGRYPGLRGLGYAARIPANSRDAAERAFGISIFPRQNREAWAIVLLEPKDFRNVRAVGFDMGSEPVRRKAMARARDENTAALSGRVRLVQEVGKAIQPGFLMYVPLYRPGAVSTVEERQRALKGFVYSPFRAADFFAAVLHPSRRFALGVDVFDGDQASPDTRLFTSIPKGAEVVRTKRLVVAGHHWTVRYAPSPVFHAQSGEPLVRFIPIGGVLVSLLLAALSFSQVRANDNLVAQTEELHRREFQQRLLARAGVLMTESLDADQRLRSVAILAVPSFADWCAVDVVENGQVRRVAVAHKSPEKVRWADELQEKYPPDHDAPTGVPNVLRTGESELYKDIPEGLLRAAARDEEHWEIIQQIGFSSAMVVPIRVRNRTLGAITFVWAESGFHYDEEDLRTANEIGLRAGVALENARLFADRDREIAERTAAEARVREVNENLERIVQERTRELIASNKELEAFCYSVSHDLRGPLRSVDGFSKALIEDYGEQLDAEAHGYIDRVRLAARRMDELITALLALSRLTRAELNLQPTSVTEAALEAADEVRRHESVRIEIQPGMTAVADPRMVRVIYDNLIGNAAKFSARSPEPCVVVGERDGAFFVRDNGVGFNPAYGAKLFTPFERLHSQDEFPGTGIGLATVQRIVTRHGGRVWAEGEEGRGATFWFTLA